MMKKIGSKSMNNTENKTAYISTEEALSTIRGEGFKTSKPTLIHWIYQYDLGHKVGGRWYISKEKFTKFLKEQFQI